MSAALPRTPWRAAFLSPLEAECLVYAHAGRILFARQRRAARQSEIEALQRRQQDRLQAAALDELPDIIGEALAGFEPEEAA